VGDNVPWQEGVSLSQTLASMLQGGGGTSPFILWVSLTSHGGELDMFEGDFLGMEGQDDAFHSAYSSANDERATMYNFV